MRIAPDGSPVELYRRLPPRTEEASLIHRLLPTGGSVIDLGCGTGRLAEPLAALGHAVTGVDNEPEMLAELGLAVGVRADIEGLDLGRRFDAGLLMSHFVDTADRPFVDAVLGTLRRHVHSGGFAVVERHPPGWVFTCQESTWEADGVRYTLCDLVRSNDVLTATVRYEYGGQVAEQRFSVRDTGDDRLAELAGAAGFRADGVLNPAGTLILLRPITQSLAAGDRRRGAPAGR